MNNINEQLPFFIAQYFDHLIFRFMKYLYLEITCSSILSQQINGYGIGWSIRNCGQISFKSIPGDEKQDCVGRGRIFLYCKFLFCRSIWTKQQRTVRFGFLDKYRFNKFVCILHELLLITWDWAQTGLSTVFRWGLSRQVSLLSNILFKISLPHFKLTELRTTGWLLGM